MSPSDIACSILSKVYCQEITPDNVASGLPVIYQNYQLAVGLISTLVKTELDSATGPLYNEIVRIKSIVADAAAQVSSASS